VTATKVCVDRESSKNISSESREKIQKENKAVLVSKGNGQGIDLIVHVCYGRSPEVDCHQSASVLLSCHVHSSSYYDSACANVTTVDLGRVGEPADVIARHVTQVMNCSYCVNSYHYGMYIYTYDLYVTSHQIATCSWHVRGLDAKSPVRTDRGWKTLDQYFPNCFASGLFLAS
jgi:hypothetical protein